MELEVHGALDDKVHTSARCVKNFCFCLQAAQFPAESLALFFLSELREVDINKWRYFVLPSVPTRRAAVTWPPCKATPCKAMPLPSVFVRRARGVPTCTAVHRYLVLLE